MGLTGEQKASALRKKIAEDQNASASFVGPKQQSQVIQEQNKLLEDQLELKKQIVESDRSAAKEAQRLAEEMGFHGQVSSLRKEGFGKAPGEAPGNHYSMSSLAKFASLQSPLVSPTNGESGIKAMHSALAGKLDKILGHMEDINGKFGGVA